MLTRLENALRLLPDPLKQAAKRMSRPADWFLVRAMRKRTKYTGPFPPAKLRARVGSGINPDTFYWTGYEVVEEVKSALAGQGRELTDFKSVYDWGCGCGRVLLWLPKSCAEGTRIIGTDVDDEAVAWAAAAWPALEVKVNPFKPPLPVGDGEVDLLISSSIFTHLTEADQDLWLAEIRRVLSPSGVAIITLAGEDMHHLMRSGESTPRSREMRERLAAMPDLDQEGFIFEPYEISSANRADFKGITDVYGATFHSKAYLAEHWRKWLTLVDHRPSVTNAAQDLAVFTRSDAGAIQE